VFTIVVKPNRIYHYPVSDFINTYCQCSLQRKLNALSQHSYFILKEVDLILDIQQSIFLKPSNLQSKALTMSNFENTSYIKTLKGG